MILLAPGAGYTHWKQTVFYFPDYATIKRDEVLEGKFSSKVNLENPVCCDTEFFSIIEGIVVFSLQKKLEFGIDFKFDGQLGSLQSTNQYFMKG